MANKRDNIRANRRSMRVKSKIKSTKAVDALRVSVFKSLNHIYAQIIDDIAQQTLVSFSTLQLTEANADKKTQAQNVGVELAKLAKNKGIKKVVFDRGQFLYHGRIKALAEGLRQGGIDF